MWHDNETTVDYLNFGIVADACAKLLQQARGEPISVGISGGWGAGKSSLVKMVGQRLEGLNKPDENSYVFVTFNPWLYQDFDSARSALLQLVGDKILEEASNREGLRDKALRLLKRINVLRLVQLGGEAAATYLTGVPVGMIGRAMKRFGLLDSENGEEGDKKEDDKKDDGLIKKAEPLSLPNEIHEFRVALEALLDELKITLVVFVDDLDRCLPKTAISTLESIRLLLFIKRSAFVIAADNDFIKGAVRIHFAGTEIKDEVATNYFDKLIQVPLHVPRLGVNEAKAYIALLLLQRACQDDKFSVDKFSDAQVATSKRLREAWRGDSVTLEFLEAQAAGDENIVELMRLADGLAPLLTRSVAVDGNPRLMKRFLNTVFLRSSLAEPQGIKLDLQALAKWHLVERCAPTLASALANLVTSEHDGRVEKLRLAEEASADGKPLEEPFNTSEPFVSQWLGLAPPLGEVDLRPLLHLSRDTATRDFGVDDLTAGGRELRDALVEAKTRSPQLAAVITGAGEVQAGLAMARAWVLKASKRTWKKAEDVLMLIETCKVFPQHSARAKELLLTAPVGQIGAGIIPELQAQPWAKEVLDMWSADDALDQKVKRAIEPMDKRKN
ncbi:MULTISPECIES: P-loop NTPase fold protein [unclassified Caballeronia]|uniref:KAP family P-loop NTPase fold protein n=1 Tax=unclassified Caballeronia TaxID=2646786 RepID=UPI001F39AC43|nr:MULTISPECIES: P-loop NTPase fold protein [unclassified Caballeronia]MCE4543041.1 NTPase KAP [Caballeronia sp. PC1]MCE4567903.1 NTPase KAP [Caballeronia sp. CLC5]